VDPETICRLGEGDVAEWHGLPAEHLSSALLPQCLGPVVTSDLRGFVLGTYRVDRHEPASGSRVDVYSWPGDDRVTIVDAWLEPPLDVARLLERLPATALTYRYRAVERELWGVSAYVDAVVEEMVWGSRGLALIIVRAHSGGAVVRVRGFQPMASSLWIDGFVKFDAIPET